MKLLIRELRRQRGMTQRELAEKMQVSFQTISKWENGINMPDVTHLPRLAEIFGVRTDVILGLEALADKTELRQFESTEYWNKNRELIRMWKEFYWNDDYFRFLVREVWGWRQPLDILDFGCGYGFLGMKFMPLLPEGSSYTGIELDEQQVREAAACFDSSPWRHDFICQDIYDYQPERKYDLVTALFLLSYMSRPELLIRKMKACLRPGGMLLLMDVNMEVEQAGYFSGLEKEDKGLRRPDFVPVWEYEITHRERDYRMGTKLPWLLKQCGLKQIRARVSDQVILYDPSDPQKEAVNERFRSVYAQEDAYQGGADYFMARGANFQKADEYTGYLKRTHEYMDSPDAMIVKTSGIYFVYGVV